MIDPGGESDVYRFVARALFDRSLTSAASWDIRLFVLLIGAVAGQGFATLLLLASLTNVVVLLRLMDARRVLKGMSRDRSPNGARRQRVAAETGTCAVHVTASKYACRDEVYDLRPQRRGGPWRALHAILADHP